MSNLKTSQIGKYVQALYHLMPRSRMWGRLFQAPLFLYYEIAQYAPDLENDYPAGVPPVNENTTTLGKFLSIFALTMYRVDDYIYRLGREAIPQMATDLLEDWERVYGIADPAATIQERRDDLDFIITNRSVPRSFEYLKELARQNSAIIELENLDVGWWNGMVEAGMVDLQAVGNPDWGGIVQITILQLGSLTIEELQAIITPEVYASAIIQWVNEDVEDIEQTMDPGDDEIGQTLDPDETQIIQG